MSPQAGFVLMDQIAPRLRNIIPAAVRPVGAEDAEELVQDAIGDSVRPPAWRGNIVAGRERAACRAERTH